MKDTQNKYLDILKSSGEQDSQKVNVKNQNKIKENEYLSDCLDFKTNNQVINKLCLCRFYQSQR